MEGMLEEWQPLWNNMGITEEERDLGHLRRMLLKDVLS